MFVKDYSPNWFEEVFAIEKAINIVLWIYVISDLNGGKLLERFTKTNCKKQIKKFLVLKK